MILSFELGLEKRRGIVPRSRFQTVAREKEIVANCFDAEYRD